MIHKSAFKGGYLDFSHLTRFKNNTNHKYLRIIELDLKEKKTT